MQQRLNLELELRNKREQLARMRHSVLELKERLDQKEMLRMGPFGMGKDVVRTDRDLNGLHGRRWPRVGSPPEKNNVD